MKQSSSKVLMIRPVKFGYNEQTAASNSFQKLEIGIDQKKIQLNALSEFDTFLEILRLHQIDVVVFDDTLFPATPDSIFPNNWISFHKEKFIVIYPMLAENRRPERRSEIIDHFKKENKKVIDISHFEKEGIFLEGTGSIVFDYENKIAYANISTRTNKRLLEDLCKQLNYSSLNFRANDSNGNDIYHTNVLMCIGDHFAVLCEECIPDLIDRKKIVESLKKNGREIIFISIEQMNSFAGNMYQLFNKNQESLIVMSEQAFRSLKKGQIIQLEKYGKLLYPALYTIEKYGGGSARCMIAEIK